MQLQTSPSARRSAALSAGGDSAVSGLALFDLKADQERELMLMAGAGSAAGAATADGIGPIEPKKDVISMVAKHLSHDLLLLKSFVEVNRTAVR